MSLMSIVYHKRERYIWRRDNQRRNFRKIWLDFSKEENSNEHQRGLKNYRKFPKAF